MCVHRRVGRQYIIKKLLRKTHVPRERTVTDSWYAPRYSDKKKKIIFTHNERSSRAARMLIIAVRLRFLMILCLAFCFYSALLFWQSDSEPWNEARSPALWTLTGKEGEGGRRGGRRSEWIARSRTLSEWITLLHSKTTGSDLKNNLVLLRSVLKFDFARKKSHDKNALQTLYKPRI